MFSNDSLFFVHILFFMDVVVCYCCAIRTVCMRAGDSRHVLFSRTNVVSVTMFEYVMEQRKRELMTIHNTHLAEQVFIAFFHWNQLNHQWFGVLLQQHVHFFNATNQPFPMKRKGNNWKSITFFRSLKRSEYSFVFFRSIFSSNKNTSKELFFWPKTMNKPFSFCQTNKTCVHFR